MTLRAPTDAAPLAFVLNAAHPDTPLRVTAAALLVPLVPWYGVMGRPLLQEDPPDQRGDPPEPLAGRLGGGGPEPGGGPLASEEGGGQVAVEPCPGIGRHP